MRLAVAARDPSDDISVQGVALLGPVDCDPEGLPALVENHAVVGHRLAYLIVLNARLSRDRRREQGKLASAGRPAADLGHDTPKQRAGGFELAVAQERDRLPGRRR